MDNEPIRGALARCKALEHQFKEELLRVLRGDGDRERLGPLARAMDDAWKTFARSLRSFPKRQTPE